MKVINKRVYLLFLKKSGLNTAKHQNINLNNQTLNLENLSLSEK